MSLLKEVRFSSTAAMIYLIETIVDNQEAGESTGLFLQLSKAVGC